MLKINYSNKATLEKKYLQKFKNTKSTGVFTKLSNEFASLKSNFPIVNLFDGLNNHGLDEITFILTANFEDLLQLSHNFNEIQLKLYLDDLTKNYPNKKTDVIDISAKNRKKVSEGELIDFYQLQIDIEKKLGNPLKVISNSFETFTTEVKSIFNYDKSESKCKIGKQQPKISDFFRLNHNEINLSTCYFCNINPVNVFYINAYHNDAIDFIKRATDEEILEISGIGIETLKKIRAIDIEKIDEDKLKNQLSEIIIEKLSKVETKLYDNFTLDHLLDKGKFPLVALSLYNFVPSCYTCNSKLKGSKQFIKNIYQEHLSPTSQQFSLDENTLFGLFFKDKKIDFAPIDKIEDFRIDFKHTNLKEYQEYLYIFKLRGRYNYFYIKKEILELIQKSRDYNNGYIDKMNDILKGQTSSHIITKEMIFGNDLFNDNIKYETKPLLKLKRDIAEQIGLK